MLIAEDWELNHRIKAAGHLTWVTPQRRRSYRPRGSLRALSKQHFRYGRWRRVVARRYPETVNPRYLAPPVATALNAAGLVLGGAGLIGALARGAAGLFGVPAGGAAPFACPPPGFVFPALFLVGHPAVPARFAADQPAG